MLNRLVAFVLEEQRYAIPLKSVRRIVRMVEVTPLPKAPDIVLGVIVLQGNIIPVMSMRRRFGLAEPEARLTDQLVVVDTATRSIALVVSSVTGVVECTGEQIIEIEKIAPGTQYVEGVTKLEDGILFIHNIDSFLSKKEDLRLDGLLAQAAGGE